MTGGIPRLVRQSKTKGERLLIVIAGPNGAGKSTFFSSYLSGLGIDFINADLIAKRINPLDPGSAAYEAAEVADTLRRSLVKSGRSFCMETVFSDPAGEKLAFLRQAQDEGYKIVLVFIGLDSPELSQARVIQRVAEGGHDVPDRKLKERFPRTFRNLLKAIEFVDWVYVLDNSSADLPYRFVVSYRSGKRTRSGRHQPDWALRIKLP